MTEIKFDKRNYRKHNDKNKSLIRKSLEECGAGRSIFIDSDGEIIGGNGVYEQAQKLKMPVKIVETDGSELVVVKRTDLKTDDEKRKKLAIMDNSTSDSSEFDLELLSVDFDVPDLQDMGIDIPNVDVPYKDGQKGSLSQRYIISPFSVLHATQWMKRKQEWINVGLHSEVGRKENLLGMSKQTMLSGINNGTSIFDPVLCEVLYSWFSKKEDFILDPFAGGSVRGIVASELERNYTGLELRKEQVEANIENANEICKHHTPVWKIGDSNVTLDSIKDGAFDMCLSCPPYADLEVYSDDPADLSNMEYSDFLSVYQSIIQKTYNKLKDNCFVCWVIGEVRDKKGNYYNFLGDTIKCFLNAGFKYYNEIVLQTAIGTSALRADKMFRASRKVCKIHQNVLVFVKGDGKLASQRLGDVEVKEIDEKSLDI